MFSFGQEGVSWRLLVLSCRYLTLLSREVRPIGKQVSVRRHRAQKSTKNLQPCKQPRFVPYIFTLSRIWGREYQWNHSILTNSKRSKQENASNRMYNFHNFDKSLLLKTCTNKVNKCRVLCSKCINFDSLRWFVLFFRYEKVWLIYWNLRFQWTFRGPEKWGGKKPRSSIREKKKKRRSPKVRDSIGHRFTSRSGCIWWS